MKILISLVYVFMWGFLGAWYARKTCPDPIGYFLGITISILLGLLIFFTTGLMMAARVSQ